MKCNDAEFAHAGQEGANYSIAGTAILWMVFNAVGVMAMFENANRANARIINRIKVFARKPMPAGFFKSATPAVHVLPPGRLIGLRATLSQVERIDDATTENLKPKASV